MKTLSVVLFGGAALALAACEPFTPVDASPVAETPVAAEPAAPAMLEAPAAPTAAPVDAAAGPAGADTKTWISDRSGENGRPRLRYVDPATGDTVIKIECDVQGALYLSLSRPMPASGKPKDWPFKVISGDLPSPSTGSVTESPTGLEVIGAYPITDGVMTMFRKDGVMSVSDVVLSDPVPVNTINVDELKAVRFLFDACEGK